MVGRNLKYKYMAKTEIALLRNKEHTLDNP